MRALNGVIVLVVIGMIVGAGLCLFDNEHDSAAHLDLCSIFFSTTNPALLAFVLGVMICTSAMAAEATACIALDLPTPPPKI